MGQVSELEAQLSQLDFSDVEYDALEEQKAELESVLPELEERVATLQARLKGRLQFEYTDPVRGFDRSKVKGTVASLVQVQNAQYTTALEVVAGGKLFQVVVDEAITGKALLGRGNLKKRCTIIPLDKIQSRHVTTGAVQRAESIAQTLQTRATPAIELVGFDEELRSAMEYVFGASIVAGTKEAAEQICFATKTRVVTVEGDTYDPSGTVTGGSKGNIGTTLSQLVELTELSSQLDEKKTIWRDVVGKLRALEPSKSSFDKLSSQLDLAKATLAAAEKHLSNTSYGLLVEKQDSFTTELEQAKEEIEAMGREVEEKLALYEELRAKEGELTNQRETRLATMDQAISDAKAKVAEKTKLARDIETKAELHSLEMENLQKELDSANEAIRTAMAALNEAMRNEAEIHSLVEEAQNQYDDARAEVEALEKRFSDCSQEVNGMKAEIENLQKLAEEAKLESKKLVVTMNRMRKERESAEKTVSSLAQKYTWIEGEKSAFGVAGGDYDFAAADPKEARRHLQELKGEQDNLVRYCFSICWL